ncbi:class I SAM-dependent methyltransferase [Mycobacterium marinum]|uniref:class I SAM-dependent methyltransferase n=1 Tax=Mycobacterium marinum TaxID=1781 RepID=UPI0021C354FE|nr:class I SAM-dependent methyltransferase [Mycobacterium marinum]GJO12389.1 hypothetical protein NJB1808e29_50480 [Mycobacterium marinum]GJP23383.1 hypothetical protein NJB1808_26380 [Mycobacterium marinum]
MHTDRQELTRQKYNKIAAQYVAGMINMALYHDLCQKPVIMDALTEAAGKSLLDLACGDGFYTRQFRTLVKAGPVSGSDLSAELISLAVSQENQKPLGIDYRVDDILNLQESRTFNTVTAIHLLHYMPDPVRLETAMRNVYRLLEPGGRFVSFRFNPDFRIELHDRNDSEEKFGYYVSKAEEKNGGLVHFHPARVEGLVFEVYRWHKSCIEDIASVVGFTNIEWRSPFVAKVGLDEFGADFFENHINNPQGKLLILTR